MRKYFHGSVLFLCILALCISGCGGGSAADPMGTGTVTLTADSTTVEPGGSCTLTATVTNIRATGTSVPVVGETVSFAVLTDNGGTISFANDKTGAGGVARATYTAGNNLIPDTVRVITSVGATATVTNNKTGTPRGKVVALTASPDPSSAAVNPGDLILITATVTDGGYAVQNERVTFSLTTSIGSSLSFQSGTTNALGAVTTMYTAGTGSDQDVITATLANGATSQMIITVEEATESITLSSSVTLPIAPGANSTMTATVKDSTGAVVSGVTVYFWLSTSNGTINQSQVTTDGSGQASVLYTAGNSLNSDVLWASTEGGASTSLVITKTGQAVGYTATMTSDATDIEQHDVAQDILLTVEVKDNSSLPAQGLRVRFKSPDASAGTGTITPSSALTGIDGKATATYHYQGDSVIEQIALNAYVDLDDDGVQDETDPTASVLIDNTN